MSYSDWDLDSELTELSTSSSESEQDYKPKKTTTTKAATKEYRVCLTHSCMRIVLKFILKIGTMMKPPRTTSYSADWVFSASASLPD